METSDTQGRRAGEADRDPPLLRRETPLGLSTPWQAPQTETATRLAGIWQTVLGIDAVGTADDFFDLGGDSFAATGLASEIEATFGLRFTPSDIITHSTVARQEAMVAGASQRRASSHRISSKASPADRNRRSSSSTAGTDLRSSGPNSSTRSARTGRSICSRLPGSRIAARSC